LADSIAWHLLEILTSHAAFARYPQPSSRNCDPCAPHRNRADLRSRPTADPSSRRAARMNPTVEADAPRRPQVVEALAPPVAPSRRAPPVHVAVDGLIGTATCTVADDLGRALS